MLTRRIPWGIGRGRRGRRRSGRMTAAAEEEDTTLTIAADRGRKVAKCCRGRVAVLYIDTPLVPSRATNHDKRGVFCHGW
jgi:hypothetical protein